MRPLVLCCARVCRASQLTGFHHHSSYLMSDCLWADKIKLQAWLISATGVFFPSSLSPSHNNMRDRGFSTPTEDDNVFQCTDSPGSPFSSHMQGKQKGKGLNNYDSLWFYLCQTKNKKRRKRFFYCNISIVISIHCL